MINVREVLSTIVGRDANKEVGLFLSGGIDSASILFALMDAGKKVTAYSFTMDGVCSQDFLFARHLARKAGVQFVSVVLPRDYHVIVNDLKVLARKCGAISKTDFECSWPFLHTYPKVTMPVVYSGMGADGHFCISKKGMIHFKDKPDVFRMGLYKNPRYAQVGIHNHMAAMHNTTHNTPFLTSEMRKIFLGTTWDQVNKPRQKQPIIDACGKRIAWLKKVNKHINLQLGDSQIASHLAGLVKTKYNIRNHKSVVGVYNDIVANKIL